MSVRTITRREAIKSGVAGIAAAATLHAASPSGAVEAPGDVVLRIGLLTDVHHADKPARGSRHYRDSLVKLEAALRTFTDQKVQAVLQLGDLIDAHATVPAEEKALREVSNRFRQLPMPYHFVIPDAIVQPLWDF